MFFFFFLISKSNSLKAQGAQPKYTRSIQEKNAQQNQERGKRAQKLTKLEMFFFFDK
jgi:hypothetical protein